MWNLRIKIDVWSAGIDESIRERNRLLLIEMYLQLPRRRVWLYLKQWRSGVLEVSGGSRIPTMEPPELDFGGPEDVIAKGKSPSCY